MKLKVGDIIKGTMFHNNKVMREIIVVHSKGYVWKYADDREPITLKNTWDSQNSNDPFFDIGWEVVK